MASIVPVERSPERTGSGQRRQPESNRWGVPVEGGRRRGRKRGSKNARITVPMVRRMQALRRAGLSAEATARVIALDYGEKPCEATVRKYTAQAVLA